MTSCTIPTMQHCGHCGCYHTGQCPRVKSIEYHENGQVKRIEYHDPQPTYVPPPYPYGWYQPPPFEITGMIYTPPVATAYEAWNHS